ncbi:ArgE/DapE family deacylase [Candidatus Thorarchaeota archaeon]|nr:MAG: ArgE/DapE family deacylase [Candidatus Thorarchaeota archaeon]
MSYVDDWELGFLRALVELDTNSEEKRNYSECSNVVMEKCKEAGLEIRVFDSKHDGIPQPNVVAELDADSDRTVLLATHYDVVPAGEEDQWTRPPFELTTEKDRVYGRGTTDNKGNIVAAVSAARTLLEQESAKVNWKILISPNEEIGGEWGIDYLINGPPKIRGDFGIVVDSSPNYISIGASGIVAGTVTVTGTQGHAGMPFAFTNAIHISIPVMNALLRFADLRRKVSSQYPAPPESPFRNLWGRFSMTVFRAGSKTNIIPGKAEISFDCRIIPEESPDEVANQISEFVRDTREETGIQVDVSFVTKANSWVSDTENPYTKAFQESVKSVADETVPLAADLGGNDGSFFVNAGIPAVCYGTIARDNNYHGIDEFMRIDDFDKVKKALIHFAETC